MREAMLTASPIETGGFDDHIAHVDADPHGDVWRLAELLLDLDGTADGVQRVGKDGQGAIPVVLDDPPAERLVLRIEHARVPGTCPQGELLVLLHQGGEADHVGEHHRCQLPVQVLTHRDGPLPGRLALALRRWRSS